MDRPPHVGYAVPVGPPPRRDLLRNAVLVLASVAAVGVVAIVVWFWFFAFRSEGWRAEVVRVDATTVCVRTLEDVDEWRLRRGDQDCLDPEDQYTAWDELDLIVGDCVRVNVHHPVTVIEQEIDCPNR